MDIMLGNDHKLTSDTHNVILNKRTMEKGDNGELIPSDTFRPIAFYPNITQACNGLLDKQIKGCDATTIEELKYFVQETEEMITAAIKKYAKGVTR